MELEELRKLLFELRLKENLTKKENSENREEKLEEIQNEIKKIRKEYVRKLSEKQKEGEKKR